MKSLQFSVPVTEGSSLDIQEDRLETFYPHFHRHEETQLMWIVTGTGTLAIEQDLIPFRNGDIFYLAANQSHVFKADLSDIKDSSQIHCVSVFFEPNKKLQGLFDLPELNVVKTFIRAINAGFKVHADYLPMISQRIQMMQQQNGIDQMFTFIQLLNDLSLGSEKHIFLSGGQSKPSYMSECDRRINKAMEYIKKHYSSTKLTLDAIASQASLTPQAFCRSFKTHSGLTYKEYLNRLRVQSACSLLATSKIVNISDIAYRSGFHSITNFNRVFRVATSMSPKQYARKYKDTIVSYTL